MTTQLFETGYNPTATRIIETALRLFMQRGYRAVSINDIVRAADVTKPTLYYHFPDKEELYVQVSLHLLASLHAAMERVLTEQEGCEPRLTGMAEVLLRERDGDIRMMRHEAQEHLSPAQRERLNEAFMSHLFAPVCAVMQSGLERGKLARHNAAELTFLFLGLIEAFHGNDRETHELTRHGAVAAFEPRQLFTAQTIVNLFLYGVSHAGAEAE